MDKKAIIVICLVEESMEKANGEIQEEIVKELSTNEPKIPWFKSIEKVTIIEET